jgi:hypothetical protein
MSSRFRATGGFSRFTPYGLGEHRYCLEGRPEIVRDYPGKNVTVPCQPRRKVSNRLCERLIERLVEADQLAHGPGTGNGLRINPVSCHAGPQRAILRYHVVKGESLSQSVIRV